MQSKWAAAALVCCGLGLGACGGGSTSTGGGSGGGVTGGNDTITATISASPTTALMSVTSVKLSATSSGSGVTYSWDFGDGTSGSGASVDKLYDKPGQFNVTMTAKDSKGTTVTAQTTVNVKSMEGFWNDKEQGYGIAIHQDHATINGRTVLGVKNLTGDLRGSVGADLSVAYKTTYFGGAFRDSLNGGKLDSGLDTITGDVDLTDGVSHFVYHMTLVRQ
jgi:PKD repeat protein